MTTEEQTIEPTFGEQIAELFSRVAKLNDIASAILNPNWGANVGIIPEGHPLYPDALESLPSSIVKPAAAPTPPQDGPHAPHSGPQRPDAGAETPDGTGGRQTGAGGRETLREQYAAAIHADAERPRGERVGIINAVLAVRDRELERLRDQVKRLGLMVDEYGAGAGALTDKITRVRMVINTHRAHLQLTDPILLAKLDKALQSPTPALDAEEQS